MKAKLVLHVYDKEGNLTKTCEAQAPRLKFGAIRSLMQILKIDDVEDTGELLATIYGAWEQVTAVLSQCFPEMEEEDWEYVELKELIPVVVTILRSTFAEILSIPNDPKN